MVRLLQALEEAQQQKGRADDDANDEGEALEHDAQIHVARHGSLLPVEKHHLVGQTPQLIGEIPRLGPHVQSGLRVEAVGPNDRFGEREFKIGQLESREHPDLVDDLRLRALEQDRHAADEDGQTKIWLRFRIDERLAGTPAREALDKKRRLELRLGDLPEIRVRVLAAQVAFHVQEPPDGEDEAGYERRHRRQRDQRGPVALQVELHLIQHAAGSDARSSASRSADPAAPCERRAGRRSRAVLCP